MVQQKHGCHTSASVPEFLTKAALLWDQTILAHPFHIVRLGRVYFAHPTFGSAQIAAWQCQDNTILRAGTNPLLFEQCLGIYQNMEQCLGIYHHSTLSHFCMN
eukprot:6289021-Amphidinium_carterae.1